MNKNKLIFILLFIEGFLLSCIELAYSKYSNSFFGNSLYNWSFIIGLTMFFLVIGYLLSLTKFVINFYSKIENVLLVFSLICVITFSLFSLHEVLFLKIYSLFQHVLASSFASAFLFLSLPISIIATIPTTITFHLSKQKNDLQSKTGNTFFVSTLGGIFGAILFGVFILPNLGYFNGYKVLSISVLIFVCITLLYLKKFKVFTLSLVFLVLVFLKENAIANTDIIYESEGLLGKIQVVNYRGVLGKIEGRQLICNNSIQTWIDTKTGNSLGKYPYIIESIIQERKSGNQIAKTGLVLGLGGGTISYILEKNNIKCYSVELDKRIAEVSKKYFYNFKNNEIIINDARKYLNTDNKTYDVIVSDVFISENPPYHILTLESFQLIKNRLSQNGIYIINFNGYIQGKDGLVGRSLVKTLKKSGFQVRCIVGSDDQETRNNIYICYKSDEDFKTSTIENTLKINNVSEFDLNTIQLNDSYVFTDNDPVLELINSKSAVNWRKHSIEYLKNNYEK
ncbi:MAG: fused MFS/spermidine synthase [Bacteroidota bacterium]